MKRSLFTLAVATLLCGTALADSKNVAISTANTEVAVRLTDEVGHREYETYLVSRTCSRQVLEGYTRECHIVTEQNCTTVQDRECSVVNGERVCVDKPTRVCHPVDRRVCRDVPYYRTEYYDCSYYDTRSWYVKDYDTVADVRVLLDNVAPGLEVKESLTVKLDGSHVSVNSSSSTSKAILLAEIDSQGTAQVTSTIHLTAIPVGDITTPLSTLKVVDVKDATGDVLVSIEGLAVPELFDLKVSLKDPKFLAKDDILAEGKFAVVDIPAVKSGKKTTLSLNLKDIGVDLAKLEKGKYKVEVELKSKLDESAIVNRKSLPSKLNSEDSDKLKIK